MRDSEARALGRLAGQAFGRPAGLVKGMHGAVASRTFRALGVLGAPTRVMHDGISSAAYRTVGAALQAPLRAGGAALARSRAANGVPLADSLPGGLALGALNGIYGDLLAREHRDLALELTVRSGGREVVTDSAGLAEAFPEATSKLAIFIHGLCETEDAWEVLPLARAQQVRRSYGSRLREQLGYTPVYVRYNTGLHVSDNGRRLAQVIEHVASGWPVDVDEIVLIGHSMGGLVARSACHYGEAEGHDWTEPLRHVFCLGTPHLGAPLERAANVAGWALGRLPETRPFAEVVNARSAGIKDLRYGNCVEEDWCDCDPDEFLRDRCREMPFLQTATYYFIGATLTRDKDSPLASLVGDLLVQFPSASGQGERRRIPFEIDNGLHLGGLNHFQLLNHPAVYEQLRSWLERRPALPQLSRTAP
ncbi:MAG: esterase/lipase family protein [Thermoleophilaceae bacterium]